MVEDVVEEARQSAQWLTRATWGKPGWFAKLRRLLAPHRGPMVQALREGGWQEVEERTLWVKGSSMRDCSRALIVV